jgi:hypothetical protein
MAQGGRQSIPGHRPVAAAACRAWEAGPGPYILGILEIAERHHGAAGLRKLRMLPMVYRQLMQYGLDDPLLPS